MRSRSFRRIAIGWLALAVLFGALPTSASAGPPWPRAIIQAGTGDGWLTALAWLPDSVHMVTLSDTGHMIFWNTKTNRVVDRLGQDNCQLRIDETGGPVLVTPLTHCVFPEIKGRADASEYLTNPKTLSISPDGKYALEVTGGSLAEITETQVFDMDARAVAGWINRRPRLWIGRSSSRLIVQTVDGCEQRACGFSIFDPRTMTESAAPRGFGPKALMAASADFERFALADRTADGAGVLEVRDARNLDRLAQVGLGKLVPREVGFSRNGEQVFVRGAGGALAIFDLRSKSLSRSQINYSKSGAILLTDIDAKIILAPGIAPKTGATLRRLDYRTGRLLGEAVGSVVGLFPHRGAVLSDPDQKGRYLEIATGAVIAIGALTGGEQKQDLAPTDGPSLALSPDGTRLLSSQQDTTTTWVQPLSGSGPRRALGGANFLDLGQGALSADGHRYAFAVTGRAAGVWVFDLRASRLDKVYGLDPRLGEVGITGWMGDGRLAVAQADQTLHWLAIDPQSRTIEALSGEPRLASARDPEAASREPRSVQTAKSAWGTNCLEPPTEPSSTPLNRDLCLYTFNYLDHGLAFKSGRTWNSLFTLYVQDDGTWFAITPENRYETKVADTPGLQWLTPARPLDPLPVQTYMRNLYEPGLMARLIDCNVVNRCAAAFKPLPNLSTLNWVLPSVSITRVKPGQEANTLDVTVEAKVGAYVSPRGVRTSSGIYDLQLFRNGKLVGQLPGARVVEEPNAAQSPATAACPWRPANRLAVGSGTLGCKDINWAVNPNARLEKTFTVAIASDPAADNIFSAYAFNEDRVKGDTFTYPNLTPRTPGPSDNQQIQQERADVSRARVGWSRRAPRAYVLAIGINAYDNRSWSLNFATTDAETIATRLRETGRLPGYSDVRTLALLAQADAGPDQPRATKTNICFALQLLARPTADAKPPDCDPRHPNTPNPLRGRGFEPASPDDVVVISFSGHGWADERTNSTSYLRMGGWTLRVGRQTLRV